jgi:membrane associated rhomboid family serine protease
MMQSKEHFKFDGYTIGLGLLFVLLFWVVYTIEVRFHLNFNQWGIRPGEWLGLRGVLFSPLIHGSLEHLWGNTLPALALTTGLTYFYRKQSLTIFLVGWLLTGLLTWFLGRNSYHIGASGVIYMLASFLFLKGIFTRHYRLMAISFIIVFLYGGMVWYVLPVERGISWEGHLSGAVVGLFLSLVTKNRLPEKKKYEWELPEYNPEDDEFMRHFDEKGNFIERLDEEE